MKRKKQPKGRMWKITRSLSTLGGIQIGVMIVLFLAHMHHVAAQSTEVQVKTFMKNFPTYHMGPDQSMPYFKDFNVPGLKFFRGTRSVYPYTFINDYRPGKTNKEYEVVRLENEFIYVDIIPALRGRVQGAVDKRNDWDFLYYNNVIKPAEISVRSAWISGGLEHNHPRGHGYTQFEKISYDIIDGEDGSKTIVIAEVETVRMMKWEFEITLHPGKLYFETKGRFFSTSPFPVPFLSSNNAAMHTTEEMELIFPQETWASGHGFRPERKWPFYGTDGSNWNWLKNIKTQASAFADGTGLYLDYWGVYSHDDGIDAGTVVVSDHRTAPGKKYFTWGSHDFGKQWDHFLSDADGGYVELQQQAYFANLGYGYAALDPMEVKEFSVFWYPIMNTGGFVKATKEVAINFRRVGDHVMDLHIQPTSSYPNSTIEILKNGEMVHSFQVDLVTGEISAHKIDLSSSRSDTVGVRIVSAAGERLIWYANKLEEIRPENDRLPDKVHDSLSIDQLYAKGISNFHDPYGTDAEEIFAVILQRDPLESRTHRQLGIIRIKRGQYRQAITHLKKSLANDHFESHYQTHLYLGYAYLQLGDLTNAHVHLVQSSRRKSQLEASLFYLAQTEIHKGDFHQSLRYLEEIPISRLSHPAIHLLKAYLHRKLGDLSEASVDVSAAFDIDPLSFLGWTEKLNQYPGNAEVIEKINFLFDRKDHTFVGSDLYLEAAVFYLTLRDFDAALEILEVAEKHYRDGEYFYPFLEYYKGYCLWKLGRREQAKAYYLSASKRDFTNVFPYRTTTADVLQSVLDFSPDDPVALMYYGDLMYYLRRHDEAIEAWKKSYRLDDSNFRVARNLGVGLFVQTGQTEQTIDLLEEALVKSGNNLRIYNELEQMYNLRGDFDELEQLYDRNWAIIKRKGDFALSCADLYLRKGRYEDVLRVLEGTYFNAVERGAGQPIRHSRYAQAQIGLGEKLLIGGDPERSIRHLKAATEYPAYLNEVRVDKPVTVRVNYLLGKAFAQLGQQEKAKVFFTKAVDQAYNHISEDAIYRAKAMKALGRADAGKDLVRAVLTQLDDLDTKDMAVNAFIKSRAHEFLGNKDRAERLLAIATTKDKDVVYKARFASSFIRLRLK